MSPREQLLKMQRIILRQLKSSVQKLQGAEAASAELNRYYESYKREFRKFQKISSKRELLRSARKADVIFGADFHAFAQSQRTHLRIIRELVKDKRPIILALEAINSSHQKFVDQYMNSKLDDKTFLKKIRYFSSWGFPWENYKVLFEFAKVHDLRVCGINRRVHRSSSTLRDRDSHSASVIAKLRRQNPGALIYVVYGDLHVASQHLPRLTRKVLGRADASRFLTIFQNSETLYWRLARQNLEEKVDVLKLRTDAFCVVNSPPWLKWQAYLQFLEHAIDHVDIDYTDHVLHLVELLKGVWRLDQNFSDFHVFSCGDGKVASLFKNLSRKELSWTEKMIKQNRSFFVPRPPVFYLYDFDINHVASLSGQYIHSRLRREKNLRIEMPRDFLASIWIESIAFFASKVVNHHRKFAAVEDLPSRDQVTLIVLEQRLREQMALKTNSLIKTARRYRSRKPHDFVVASNVLGAHLGNRIYSAFQLGRLDHDTLHSWLRKPISSDEAFVRFYTSVIKFLKDVPVKERSKNERL